VNNRLAPRLRWVGISLIILSICLPCFAVLPQNLPDFSWGLVALLRSLFLMPFLLGLGLLCLLISLLLEKKHIAATLVASVCVLAVVFGGLFLRTVFFFPVPHAPQIPEQLKRAGVLKGEDTVSKSSFYVRSALGVITDFALDQSGQLAIAGLKGAAFIDSGHSLRKVLSFERCYSSVSLVFQPDGNVSAFLCRGSWIQSAQLSSVDGKTLWSYGGNGLGVDDAVVANFGGNETDYVVGFNGDGGVHLLDSTGKRVWRYGDGNVWHVEVVNDGVHPEPVIVHSNGRGVLTIRDKNGKVLQRNPTEVYLGNFSLVSWGPGNRRDKLITADADHVYIISLDGKTIATLTSGISEKGGKAITYGIPLETTAGTYFAVLQRYELWDRSLLEIFDAQNQPIYVEVFAESCGALQALKERELSNGFIVGCDGKVWRYRIGADGVADRH